MSIDIKSKVEHLVVDRSAFIRNSPVNLLGNNIYTVNEVVDGIRDEALHELLQSYGLKFREPCAEDIKFVSDFSKKTSNYQYLSLADIKLIALTYLLEKEYIGKSHLRTEPYRVKITTGICKHVDIKEENKDSMNEDEHVDENSNSDAEEENEYETEEKHINDDFRQINLKHKKSDVNQKENDDEYDEEGKCEYSNDDFGGDWITPSNINEIKKRLNNLQVVENEEEKPLVACATTNFSMQSVLMQIGLKVVSVDTGLVIKQAKQYVLRCHACFKIEYDDNKKFCSKCGNLGTLQRIPMTVNENGESQIDIDFKNPINIRGTRYSLPRPKGGKHANNPILFEDQRMPQQRNSKFSIKEKNKVKAEKILTDPDYVTRSSPFAINDVYSRASRFKASSHLPDTKRNPNEAKKSTGNRKKRNNRL